jgi:hypothetical protein
MGKSKKNLQPIKLVKPVTQISVQIPISDFSEEEESFRNFRHSRFFFLIF